jgi:FlaA1/EpsC-like NDP-sugar epimerase
MNPVPGKEPEKRFGGVFPGLASAMFETILRYRAEVKFLLHLGIFLSAYYIAYLVRFDFGIPPEYLPVMRGSLPVLLAAKVLGFLAFGLLHGWWRYVSIRDVFPVAAGCTLGSVLFAGTSVILWGPTHIPRSIYLLDWGNTLLITLALRYAVRMGRESFGRDLGGTVRRVLIVGAGSAGRMIAREITENPALGMIGVGFVDDDPAKIGTRIEGLRVLGDHEKIEVLCGKHDVGEIIIAIPSARPFIVRHIVEHCKMVTAKFRILPGVGELIDGRVGIKDLRNVKFEDLLGRDPVDLDTDLLSREISGNVVMVTGAAGSIGAELCRQVARLAPARLVLFEIGETPLFDLEHSMRESFPDVNLVPVIGDVRDYRRVQEVIASHAPSVIFHAAAYKHVPVMEVHPVEAIKTNVLGTRIVAEVAAEQRVSRFVLVSSDKAVRPTSVMGATKRVAEMIIQDLNREGGGTVYVAVRFGNVLDSAGSVIPIFRRQLETTGRLTVTHPEASRYFMMIQEAAGLILQAGSMGKGGEIFVLDMGNPVKIVDLARNVIRLSGKEEGVDAEIVYTGLRPGEKLHEELVVEGEDATKTSHPKVMKLIGNGVMTKEWHSLLAQLLQYAMLGDRQGVVRTLGVLVKGYTPDYAFHGIVRKPEKMTDVGPSPETDLYPPVTPPSKSLH